MTDEPDLFNESTNPSTREGIKSFLRTGSDVSFHLSLEKIIVISAVVTVVIVASYVMGFMKGKASGPEATHSGPVRVSSKPSPGTSIPLETKPLEYQAVDSGIEEAQLKPVAKKRLKPYTIQVVAYRSRNRAVKEVETLKEKGFDARILLRGKYFQVCVGRYADRKDAAKDMKVLRKEYKDGYLRNIPS